MDKLAGKRIFFHGTSFNNLQSILAEGLVTYRKKVWTHDFSQKRNPNSKSLESYGGIYLSESFLTAYGAAGTANLKHNEKSRSIPRVIAMVEIEDSSPHILMDEDRVSDPSYYINRYFHVNANTYFYEGWIEENFNEIEKVANNYIDAVAGDKIHQNHKNSLLPIAIETIKSFVFCELGRELDYIKNRFSPAASEKILSINPTIAEQNYRTQHNLLISKLGRLPKTSKNYTNLRSLENIGFAGSNKVMGVFVIKSSEDPQYYENIDVYYLSKEAGNAFQHLLKEFSNLISGNCKVQNVNTGEIYLDNPDQSKKLVANWLFEFFKSAMPLPFYDSSKYKINQPGVSNIDRLLSREEAQNEELLNPDIRYFNAGTLGTVYETNNGTVIKYTASKQEYLFATKLISNPIECFVKVYNTRQINKDVYAIETEKVSQIDYYSASNYEKRYQWGRCMKNAGIRCDDISNHENFGITKDGRLVLLDLDQCYFYAT